MPAPDDSTETPSVAPHRVRLSRAKGWKMPEDAVKVDRTTRWGNPYTPQACGSIAVAVERHGQWMRGERDAPDGRAPPTHAQIREALAGRHLACWCPLDGPCHAGLLLEIANSR